MTLAVDITDGRGLSNKVSHDLCTYQYYTPLHPSQAKWGMRWGFDYVQIPHLLGISISQILLLYVCRKTLNLKHSHFH